MHSHDFQGLRVYDGLLNEAWRDLRWATVQRFSGLAPAEIPNVALFRSAATGHEGQSPSVTFRQVETHGSLNAYYLEAQRLPVSVLRCRVQEDAYRFRVSLSGRRCYDMADSQSASEGGSCLVFVQRREDELSTYFLDRRIRVLTLQCNARALAGALGIDHEELHALIERASGGQHRGQMASFALTPSILTAAEDLVGYDGACATRFRDVKSIEIALRMIDRLAQLSRTKQRSCVEAVRARVAADPARPLEAERLTSAVGINRTTLRAYFKRETGYTMAQYRDQLRWTQARELLTGSELSVKQIAFSVGFRHAANFSTAFRQRFGLSPAELRKK